MRNYCRDKSETSASKSSEFTSTQDYNPFYKAKKDKKNKLEEDNLDSTNPVTKVNATKVDTKKKKKKDINKIMYYNRN